MKNRNTFIQHRIRRIQAEAESLPGVPIVEIAGESRVLIENHLGILQYGYDKIVVKLSYGNLCICGDHLTMAQMTKHQLVVLGEIQSVSIMRGVDK